MEEAIAMQTEYTDGAILIRPYTETDAELLYEAARECLPETQWMPWCHEKYAPEESRSWVAASIVKWAEGREYNFVIADAKTGAYLGGAGLNRLDTEFGIANLGYWVRASHRGKGVAAAAARLVARFGVEQVGLHRLEIVVAVENESSCRAAEKAGAAREGILRNRLLVGGKRHDAFMHSLVPADLTENKGNLGASR